MENKIEYYEIKFKDEIENQIKIFMNLYGISGAEIEAEKEKIIKNIINREENVF